MKRLPRPATVMVVMFLAVLAGIIIPFQLSQNARNTLAAAAGLLAAVAALAYAVLTFYLVDATERLTRASAETLEAQTRPNVVVHAEIHGFMAYLVIENMGAGEAFDVRLTHVGDLTVFPDQLVANAAFWNTGFRYLAPRQRHAAVFFNGTRLPPENPEVTVTARYRSRAGKGYEADFPFNIAELRNLSIQYTAEERGLLELRGIHEDLTAIRRRVERQENE